MNDIMTIEHAGIVYRSAAVARAADVPAPVIGAGVKAAAIAEIRVAADGYRARLASASAGKLAEYRIKEEITRDPAKAADEELAMLDREALARGMDREALLAGISAKAAAYRRIALLVGALEAEAGAAITAIPNNAPDIETQIHSTLSAAKAQADAAFAEAVALIDGGS